jgi:probable HAF family extracellular repeat protein
MKKAILGLAIVPAILLWASASQAVTYYSITDLGTGTLGTGTYTRALNNNGQVAGGAGDSMFFYNYNGSQTQIINPTGTHPALTMAWGINSSGHVVGDASGTPFIWKSNDDFTLLPIPINGSRMAVAINDSGVVAGWASDYGNPTPYAFTYDPAATTPEIRLEGPGGIAYTINNNGQAAGSLIGGSNAPIVALFGITASDHSVGLTLGDSSQCTGAAFDINDAGHIVGNSMLFDFGIATYHRAFFYDGTMLDLGTLAGTESAASYALGINSLNQVVGYSDAWDANHVILTKHAFISSYDADTLSWIMTDLNDLIDPAAGFGVLIEATAINDKGQILVDTSSGHTLLLTIPEPSTLVLLGIGAASLLGYAWRRRSRA